MPKRIPNCRGADPEFSITIHHSFVCDDFDLIHIVHGLMVRRKLGEAVKLPQSGRELVEELRRATCAWGDALMEPSLRKHKDEALMSEAIDYTHSLLFDTPKDESAEMPVEE